MLAKRKPLPGFVTWTVAVLVATIAVFWGYRAGVADGLATARLTNTRAKMQDGTCLFSAAFQLGSALDQVSFAYHESAIRDAIVASMRSKSRYMVTSPWAKKGLSVQMVNAANRVVGRPIAKALTFENFQITL